MIAVGDCRELMRGLRDSDIQSVVCDPPYELDFMGKAWDRSGVAFQPETWAEALRVLKPGGHLLAFGGTRTYHRLTCAIEDAGFEIRDCLAWLYGSGFPKSHNIGGGLGTALKPAFEPIVMARKPLTGTVQHNWQEHGTGPLNIDGCRIGTDGGTAGAGPGPQSNVYGDGLNGAAGLPVPGLGRWPANVLLDEEAAALLDEQTGELPAGYPGICTTTSAYREGGTRDHALPGYNDTGGASRFFYTAKASRAERNAGLEGFEDSARPSLIDQLGPGSPGHNYAPTRKNPHPTVKPIDLMRWLCRLVTPPGGIVLDPFTGSGTTGCAAALEGFDFIGIEQSADYAAIADARIAFWAKHGEDGMRIVHERDAAEREHKALAAMGQMNLLEAA